MYEEYWKLREKPFENTPDPRFIYYSHGHKEALMKLLYAIRERKGATMLTGEYGCGKTVLSRALLDKLDVEKYDIALVANPFLDSVELLREILYQFGIELSSRPKIDLLHPLNDHLRENLRKERDSVIVIDEAQSIRSRKTFEELRMLLNFQLSGRFLLTLVLIGQPELKKIINEIRQLEQRLTIRYHLNALTEEETARYIVHRLEVAGRTEPIFDDGAFRLTYELSRGIPRLINNLCDMSLFVGYTKKLERLDDSIVYEAQRGLEGEG